MEYIRIDNGMIAEHTCGSKPDGQWVQLSAEFWGAVGEPVGWYDEDWNRIDDLLLYKMGKKQLPQGMRLNEQLDALVELNENEKIVAGLKPVPFGYKIAKGKLVAKTQRELWLDGDISTEEYSKHKQRERNQLLADTDKYLVQDFPILEDGRERIRQYRQQLRDITTAEGWPDVEFPPLPDTSEAST